MAPAIEIAAKEFLMACRADGLSPNTTNWYRHMLRPLTARFFGRQIDALQTAELREYIVSLRERKARYVNAAQRPQIAGGLSHESLRDHLRAMRRFFNWCFTEYDLGQVRNPMLKIRMPGREHAEPKAIALEDLRALLLATGDDLPGIRDRAMIAFLADTGCRAAGLLTLTLENLHIPEGHATVTEKGRRDRRVPFTSYTAELLRNWLDVRPFEANRYVFCGLGTNSTGKPLKLSGLHGVLKRLKRQAGITGRVNPHSFRHGFARQYLLNGGDVGILARLMGHSDVSVTIDSYGIFQDRELAQAHDKFTPMRNLKGGL